MVQDGPRQADELALADAEVGAALGHGRVEAAGQGLHDGPEAGGLERGQDGRVVVLLKGVEVLAQVDREEDRVLRDDANCFAQYVKR